MSTVSDNDNDSGRIYEEVKLVSSANVDNRVIGTGSNGGYRVSGESSIEVCISNSSYS